jgi:very-short-patch-repair endonuclease
MTPQKHPPISQVPTLINEWNFERNTLNPSTTTSGSGKKAWWKCSKNHEWESTICDRTLKNNGCPYCSGRLPIQGTNDLITTHPDIATQWHSLNNKLLPSEVSAGSSKKVWWQDSYGHEWQATVNSRTSNNLGCPICSNRKLLIGFNDLATMHPLLAAEWHPTKNAISSSDILTGSNTKVWWQDSHGHEWQALVSSRIVGNGCPVCVGQKVQQGFNDLATTTPSLLEEWHWDKNNAIAPVDITKSSTKEVWWICVKKHEWKASPKERVQGGKCPACEPKKNKEYLKENPELLSFVNEEKITADLDTLTVGSSLKIWWKCNKGHEWEASIANFAKSKKCIYCSNKKILSGFNDLTTLRPELMLEWSYSKNTINPENIGIGSTIKVWWQCERGHEWESRVYPRSFKSAGCPYCSNYKAFSGFNDLATKLPELAKQWHPTKNADLTPNMVTVGSAKQVWWQCEKGHEWKIGVTNRTRNNASGCPQCASGNSSSKAEILIANSLSSLIQIETNYRNIPGVSEVDIYVPSKKVAIEYNGLYWHSEVKGKDRNYHYNKWLACQKEGIQLIQIWEDDWNRNSEGILNSLKHKLNLGEQEKVMARKTDIAVLDKHNARKFLNANHIQGYANGTYYLGLKDRLTQEIIAVLVLKKEAGSNGKELNIIRYATSKQVTGGFTKLLKFAEKSYEPEKFITFSDHCISNGKLYENNGFIADKELAPDYMYMVNGERKHKFGYRLKRFKNDETLEYKEGMTEKELAELNKLHRIWDAGKTRWIKIINR